jgi:hypothetical protein
MIFDFKNEKRLDNEETEKFNEYFNREDKLEILKKLEQNRKYNFKLFI